MGPWMGFDVVVLSGDCGLLQGDYLLTLLTSDNHQVNKCLMCSCEHLVRYNMPVSIYRELLPTQSQTWMETFGSTNLAMCIDKFVHYC